MGREVHVEYRLLQWLSRVCFCCASTSSDDATIAIRRRSKCVRCKSSCHYARIVGSNGYCTCSFPNFAPDLLMLRKLSTERLQSTNSQNCNNTGKTQWVPKNCDNLILGCCFWSVALVACVVRCALWYSKWMVLIYPYNLSLNFIGTKMIGTELWHDHKWIICF